jgi:preprotein translocase subunit SecE
MRQRRSIRGFLREVVAELRKVIWPGRRELITYTTVVIVFVAFIVALVAGLDVLFAKGVLAVFG